LSEQIHTPRRFQRVPLKNISEDLRTITGAKVGFSDFRDLKIYDISYRGAAFEAPSNCMLEPRDEVLLNMYLADEPRPLEVRARVVWTITRMIGVEFQPLDSEQRKMLDHFLRSKLAGNMLRQIDPQYVSDHENVDYWFHGPNDTNIYIWHYQGNLTKAVVELFEHVFYYENRQLVQSERSLEDGSWTGKNIILQQEAIHRVIGLLSQVEDPEEVLKPLIKAFIG
jgi:hypothetical protein